MKEKKYKAGPSMDHGDSQQLCTRARLRSALAVLVIVA
jgi:hypothetical protein